MPILLMLAPVVIGVVVAMLVIRLWPRPVPNLPRRVTTLAVVGIGLALVIEFVVLVSGSWPFQSIGHAAPFEWLSGIPGRWQFVAPLLGGVVASVLLSVPAPAQARRDGAALARRTPFTFVTFPWLITTAVLVAVAILLAVAGGLASQPGEDGHYTMWMQDAGLGDVGRLIYGWAFSGPSLVLLLLLAITTLVGLALIARPPLADSTEEDVAIRRARSHTLLAATCGAALIHVGAVLIFFAYTANLSTGVPVGEALVPVYPPFAVLAPVFLGLGIGAIIVGFVLWFRLLIEQLTAASRAREDNATHAH
ncbi:hypothetical protein P4U43_08140 [Arthrobacter sp. EH-1B-1]|uniref:Uncharacterized protein n=1 Tax=Arthrobacter vasquezii TaxID=2977629 RepID=A0ABT6CUK6_9MICC|nr:hypothetical protein [Arthrobacter vasquezii]MDF9277757.1 hypothetical protein [Arthrobacter vasquezii]